MSSETQREVLAIIGKVLGRAEALELNHHLVNDLGANSLDVVELIMRVEERFGLRIPEDVSESVATVADVIAYVESLEASQRCAPGGEGGRVLVMGSDHSGVALKRFLGGVAEGLGFCVEDLGPASEEACDYPTRALAVAQAVASGGGHTWGLLICSTGIGMSIAANKVPGVRAALVRDAIEAEMTRRHNDANVMCLGAKMVGELAAQRALESFLRHEFEAGDDGRHARRVQQIRDAETATH